MVVAARILHCDIYGVIMKERFKIILLIIAITAYIAFDVYGDYTWGKGIIQNYQNEGWTIVYKQDNYASVTSPWTLIKTPVTGYWMVNVNGIKRYHRSLYLVPVAHVYYDYAQIKEDVSIDIIDVARRQAAYATPEQIKTNDLKHLQRKDSWYSYAKEEPGYEIIEYVTKKAKSF